MSGGFSKLLDLLFPPRCVYCRKFLRGGEKFVCSACSGAVPLNEEDRKGDFFRLCVAPLRYEGRVRDSVLRFKFRGATNYAPYYGKLLAGCIASKLAGKYDIVTWVPLSVKRMKSRGYDQAMLLAMAAALELDDVAVELLKKTVDVPAQSGVGSAEKRRANINGAYEAVNADMLLGKRVLIIDDIITTGSTLSECARTLLMAGAEEVYCAAFANAGGK